MDAAITAHPAEHSWSLPATDAITHLKRVRFLSAREALERLVNLMEMNQILCLYRKYFPQEYARSTACLEIPVSQAGESGYSEKEVEFLVLVDKRLFPLPIHFLEEMRWSMIPIEPQGVDEEDDIDCLRLPLQAGMALYHGVPSLLWEQWLPASVRPVTAQLDWAKFSERCQNSGGLTALLPLLLRFVSNNTGILWFDMTRDNEVLEYAWLEEDIQFLAKEWHDAQRFMKKLDPLLERMEKHPRYWLTQLVRLWDASLQ